MRIDVIDLSILKFRIGKGDERSGLHALLGNNIGARNRIFDSVSFIYCIYIQCDVCGLEK